jgi:hypothetical protein
VRSREISISLFVQRSRVDGRYNYKSERLSFGTFFGFLYFFFPN